MLSAYEEGVEVGAVITYGETVPPHPIVAVDQEGGRVVRFRNGFTPIPSAAELGATYSEEEVYRLFRQVGSELRRAGITINFAPVVDLSQNDRSFGQDPEKVTRYAGAVIDGLLDAGILPCLKHFVGYGSASGDAHAALPTADWDPDALIPYRHLASWVPMIMTAHLRIPALDPDHCATLSPTIVRALLRGELNFKGVIVTDSLTMHGVLEEAGSLEEAAIQALEAGCDLLLLGGRALSGDPFEPLENARRVHKAVVEAVHSGRLTESRLDESVERVGNIYKWLISR